MRSPEIVSIWIIFPPGGHPETPREIEYTMGYWIWR